MALDLTFEYLEKSGHQEIELHRDFYWSIPPQVRFDPYSEPAEMTMGQLSDDWAHVCAIASGSEEPIAYSLVWIAAVLRAVGETANDGYEESRSERRKKDP